MNTISNFFLANLAERLTPLLQTPVEDIVYEILDRKGLPTRSEIRDLKNRLERMDEEIKAMRDEFTQIKVAPGAAAAPAVATAPSVTKSGKRRGRPPRQGPPPICIVPGCTLHVRSKGFCAKHYQAWRRGRLTGFVDPDGFVKVSDKRFKIEKRLAAQTFDTKVAGQELTITIKGKDYVRLLDADKKKSEAAPATPKKSAPKKAAPKKAAPKKAAPKKKATAGRPSAKKK